MFGDRSKVVSCSKFKNPSATCETAAAVGAPPSRKCPSLTAGWTVHSRVWGGREVVCLSPETRDGQLVPAVVCPDVNTMFFLFHCAPPPPPRPPKKSTCDPFPGFSSDPVRIHFSSVGSFLFASSPMCLPLPPPLQVPGEERKLHHIARPPGPRPPRYEGPLSSYPHSHRRDGM